MICVPSSLNPISFAPFGTVIQNPHTHANQPSNLSNVQANQNTATKWLDVSHLENWYHLAPSRQQAKSVMNMFVCRPRSLRNEGGKEFFDVKVLERHPFTPQTFIPIGVSPHEDVRYLVIVAPTLKPARRAEVDSGELYVTDYRPKKTKKSLRQRLLGARPNPFTNDYAPCTTPSRDGLVTERKPKGRGEPDLENLRAFIARGDQAVTYGPGTWHAPMVVLGSRPIDFVVVQYANGVAIEDCQEVDIPDGALSVEVVEAEVNPTAPGIMRARL